MSYAEQIACKMLDELDKDSNRIIPSEVRKAIFDRVRKAEKLVRSCKGQLISRQVIAAIIMSAPWLCLE